MTTEKEEEEEEARRDKGMVFLHVISNNI